MVPLTGSVLAQIKTDSGTRDAAFDLINVFSFTTIRQTAPKQLRFTQDEQPEVFPVLPHRYGKSLALFYCIVGRELNSLDSLQNIMLIHSMVSY